MSNVRDDVFVDTELSITGHTALVTYDRSTRSRTLSCHHCNEQLGRFPTNPWLATQIGEAWESHLAAWIDGREFDISDRKG